MNTNLSLTDRGMEANKDFLKLYSRVNKLISAVFLVVNVVDNNHEIKARIKELAIQTMSLCVELKDMQEARNNRVLSSIEKKILELLSLLDVASVSGLVSEMNAGVLKTEFQLFLNSLSSFAESFQNSDARSVRNVLNQNNFAENKFVLSGDSTQHNAEEGSESKPTIKDEDKRQNRKTMRQSAILDFIRTHPNISIKEITPHIRGCGEKTIQRELVEMVVAGQMKRMGERRWSRYSVA